MIYVQEFFDETNWLVGLKSPLHEGLFARLKRRYLRDEKALPNDLAKLQEWTGAVTRSARMALQELLDDLFELSDIDGRWHRDDWDERITDYQRSEPDRAARAAEKKAREDEKLRRHREERNRLRADLKAAGISCRHDLPMGKLRALHERHVGKAPIETPPATPPETAPATGLQPPATGNHYPETTIQQPPTPQHLGQEPGGGGGVETGTGNRPETAPETGLQVDPVQAAADALKAAGLRVHHTCAALKRLVAAGWTAADILAQEPAGGWARAGDPIRDPCAYVETKLRKQMEVGAVPASRLPPPPPRAQESGDWRDSRKGIEDRGESLGLGRWVQSEWEAGRAPSWPEYRAKVLKAAGVMQAA